MLEIFTKKITTSLRQVWFEADHDGSRIDYGTLNEDEVKILINDLAGAIMELCD